MNLSTRSLCHLVLALTLLGASATSGYAQSVANLVLNPSFEDPALVAGGNAKGSGTDWTVTTTGIPAGEATVYTNGAGDGTTPYGNQWLQFTSGTTDSQTINGPFTANAVYTFSLECADNQNIAGQQLTLTVTGGGLATAAMETFTIPQNPDPHGTLAFVTYSLAFIPTANAPVTISFANDANNDIPNALAADNVVLIPEPSTWALLGVGAIGLGLASRRRSGSLFDSMAKVKEPGLPNR